MPRAPRRPMLLPSYQLPHHTQHSDSRGFFFNIVVLLKHFDCILPLPPHTRQQRSIDGPRPVSLQPPLKNAVQPSNYLIKGEERQESPGPQQIPSITNTPLGIIRPRETWSLNHTFSLLHTRPYPSLLSLPRSTPPRALRVRDALTYDGFLPQTVRRL